MRVVLWSGEWCRPCQAVKRTLERLSAELGFELVVLDVAFMTDAAAQLDIRTVPTIQVGKARLVGAMGEAALRAAIIAEMGAFEA